MDTNRLPKQALQYKPKGRRNIGRPKKRWSDRLHLEDQGTGNMPNPSGTWWWWALLRLSVCLAVCLFAWDNRLSLDAFLWNLALEVPSSKAEARTRTPGTLLKHKPIQTIWYAATPPRLAYVQLNSFGFISGGISCVSEQTNISIKNLQYGVWCTNSYCYHHQRHTSRRQATLAGGQSFHAIKVQRDCSYLSMFLRRFGANEEQLICCVLFVFM